MMSCTWMAKVWWVAALMMPGCTIEMTGGEDELFDESELAVKSEGERLFRKETFGGNGRRCVTCHSRGTGTISPEDVQERLADDFSDPLFVHDGLDADGVGTSRIAEHATIAVAVELPPHVWLADDPSATHVVLNRGVPTTVNTPALDPVLMYDMREESLQAQALGAINGHAQASEPPSPDQLDAIAEFQQTDPKFFSSVELQEYAAGGPAPSLPAGTTESEIRGRAFFENVPFEPPSKAGMCALCHSGPMLNQANDQIGQFVPAPPGARSFRVLVSERNLVNNPVRTFMVDNGLGEVREVRSPDPGILLTPPHILQKHGFPPPFLVHPAAFAGGFKTPPLWGVKRTAPYFHDNSAKTLEELMEHYQFFFDNSDALGGLVHITQQDMDDAVAYLKLL